MAESTTVTLSSVSLNAATYAERFTLPMFRLRALGGPDAGAEGVFARRAIVVGTSPDCDLVLTDSAVSRQHLRIVGERAGYRIADLDSKNGTWFAGARLGQVVAGATATLRLGQTELLYEQLPELHEVSLSRDTEFGQLQGQSAEMRETFARLAALAASDMAAVIEGEPGTGKRAAATALHQRSSRAEHPLVIFDCSTADLSIVEQSLGAEGSLYLESQRGTLLLLELDELPLALQAQVAKQLTLQGEVAARLVATLGGTLDQAVREARLHKDLKKILQNGRVTLPALRHRTHDIELLVETFLAEIQLTTRGARPMVIGHRTMRALLAYPWPGNVRELRRHLERAAQMATSRTDELPVPAPGRLSEPILLGGQWRALAPDDEGAVTPYAEARTRAMTGFDHAYCKMVLAAAGGDAAVAAQLSGLARPSFDQLVLRTLGGEDGSK